jgi:hypothetical protein
MTTKNQFIEFVERDSERILEMLKAKNNDYTAGSDSAFANFDQARLLGIEPIIGVMIRFLDKVKRMETFAKTGSLEVKQESVFDALDDMEGYIKIMKKMLSERHYP